MAKVKAKTTVKAVDRLARIERMVRALCEHQHGVEVTAALVAEADAEVAKPA